MKVLTLILFLPIIGFSQLTDTTCIKARWIALQRLEPNLSLFDSTLLINIRDLVAKGKLYVYEESKCENDGGIWYRTPTNFPDSLAGDTTSLTKAMSHFEITLPQSDIPLVDEYGDPIIVIIDGIECYKYPTPKVIKLRSLDITEFRIKEENIDGEMVPTGLSFLIDEGKYNSERCWIYIEELFNNCPNVVDFDWFYTIKNQTYQGFQYLQSSCYENVVRY